MRRTLLSLAFLAAITLFLLPAAARADIVFIVGQTTPAAENVIFGGPGTVSTGNPVTGRTSQTNQLLAIGSDVTLNTFTAPGGRALVDAGSQNFTTLTFQFVDPAVSFTELDFNIVAFPSEEPITFTVTEINGQVNVFSSRLNLNSLAFFSFESHSGQFIRSVSFTTTGSIATVRDFRVGGVGTQVQQPIPEPATMILLGTGLAGVAAKVRKRRKG